jgi:hypothetical protein
VVGAVDRPGALGYRAYGAPALIELAAASGGLPNVVPELPAPGALRVFSKVAAALALVVALLLNRWSKPR